MKKTIISCFIGVIALLFTLKLEAQSYDFDAGLKFGGYENGFSFKYNYKPNVDLEGVFGFRNHGVVITGLYEIHSNAFDVNGLRFYYGAGAHLGGTGNGEYHTFSGNDQLFVKSNLLLGADGVVGFEFLIPQSPIAVSLDLNPRIELTSGPFFDISPGLGLKYTF